MARIITVSLDNEPVLDALLSGCLSQGFGGDKATAISVFDASQNRFNFLSQPGTAIGMLSNYDEVNTVVFPGSMGIGLAACKTSSHEIKTANRSKRPFSMAADATAKTTEEIFKIMRQSRHIKSGIRKAMREIEAPFALVFAYPGGLIGARNTGIMPLVCGKITPGNDQIRSGFFLASQTEVVEGGKFLQEIEPGQMVVIENNSFPKFETVLDDPYNVRCIMEILYLKRPDNFSCGHQIEMIRQIIGRTLGQKLINHTFKGKAPKNCVIVPIPKGGDAYAIGMAQETGLPLGTGAIYKPSHNHVSVAVVPGMSIAHRYSVIRSEVDGRIVVLVDDIMRRGGHIEELTRMLLQSGALEVHVVVVAKTFTSCPYSKGGYTFEGSPRERTSEVFGSRSMTHLYSSGIIKAIDSPHEYCTKCLEY